jgi:hypothetical protein
MAMLLTQGITMPSNPTLVPRAAYGNVKLQRKKWLVVVYREVSRHDGFIISAYFLSEKPKGEIVWRQS